MPRRCLLLLSCLLCLVPLASCTLVPERTDARLVEIEPSIPSTAGARLIGLSAANRSQCVYAQAGGRRFISDCPEGYQV